MNDWLIRQRYGFGAGRVRLAPAIYRANEQPWTLREGARRMFAELELDGARATVVLGGALVLCLAVVFAPVIAMLPFRTDRMEIDMVLIETAKLEPPPPYPPASW